MDSMDPEIRLSALVLLLRVFLVLVGMMRLDDDGLSGFLHCK